MLPFAFSVYTLHRLKDGAPQSNQGKFHIVRTPTFIALDFKSYEARQVGNPFRTKLRFTNVYFTSMTPRNENDKGDRSSETYITNIGMYCSLNCVADTLGGMIKLSERIRVVSHVSVESLPPAHVNDALPGGV